MSWGRLLTKLLVSIQISIKKRPYLIYLLERLLLWGLRWLTRRVLILRWLGLSSLVLGLLISALIVLLMCSSRWEVVADVVSLCDNIVAFTSRAVVLVPPACQFLIDSGLLALKLINEFFSKVRPRQSEKSFHK